MVKIRLPSLRKIKKRCRQLINGGAASVRREGVIGKRILIVCAAVALVIVAVIACCSRKSTGQQQTAALASPVPADVSSVTTPAPSPVIETSAITGAEEPEQAPEPTPTILYKKGDDGEEITEIQERLMELGYLDIDEPGTRYGSATRDAVELFQRQHGLDQDGIVGNATYDLLMSKDAKSYVMYEGASGSDIKAFQTQLYELGYLKKSQITGYYGTDTVDAVKAFQKRNKLSQDGKAGEATIETINSAKVRVSASKEATVKAEKAKAAEEAKKKSLEGRIDSFISVAKSKIGCTYKLGESGPDRFDCSGFVYYTLRKSGVYCLRLNAKGYSQNTDWTKVSSFDDIKRGDLLFFKMYGKSGVGHVGIYLGDGEMIDASTQEGKIVIRSCTTSFWKRRFVCARRPFEK